jgi:hypothetical protein
MTVFGGIPTNPSFVRRVGYFGANWMTYEQHPYYI